MHVKTLQAQETEMSVQCGPEPSLQQGLPGLQCLPGMRQVLTRHQTVTYSWCLMIHLSLRKEAGCLHNAPESGEEGRRVWSEAPV